VGHITIDANSKTRCGCGGYGHWEAFCGGKNLPKHATKIINKDSWRRSLVTDMTGGDLTKMSTKTIFDAAKQGDEVALRVVEEVGRINAVGFANIVNAYDPELITIGGSIALNNPELILEPILQHIDKYLLNRRPEIMVTPLGEDIVLMGALALAIEST
jgi:glucokinase